MKNTHYIQKTSFILAFLFCVNNFESNATEGYLFNSASATKSFSSKDKFDSFFENGMRYYSYSPGIYAPFGIMMGIQTKNYGLYFSARMNKNVFKKSGQYYFDGTSINDHSLNWKYNNEKIYSRYEANVGFMHKLYEKDEQYKFVGYIGVGVIKARYMYSFTQVGLNSISKQRWVLYKEISKMTINTEAGVVFQYHEFLNFQIGISGISRKYERMITMGIGISKPRNSLK